MWTHENIWHAIKVSPGGWPVCQNPLARSSMTLYEQRELAPLGSTLAAGEKES